MGNFLTVISPWSSQATYTPVGKDWDSQPTKQAPPYTYFSPLVGNAPTATQFNYLLNQRDTWIANLNAWTGQLDGQNWGALVALSTIGTAAEYIRYTGSIGAWVARVNSTYVYYSTDGVNWAQLGTTALAAPVGGFVTTADGKLIVPQSSNTQTYVPSSNTWAAQVAGPAGFSASPRGVTFVGFKGGLVLAQTLSAGAAQLAWSANDAATWTVSGSALPANFGQNAGALGLLPAVGLTAMLLFANTNASASYLYSTDGQTWATETLPALLGGEAVLGAGCDQTNGIFYVVLGTNAECRVFASTTGLTGSWGAPVAVFAHEPGQTVSGSGEGCLAVNGPELALLLTVGPAVRVMLSSSANPSVWGFAKSPALSTNGVLHFGGSGFIYEDDTDGYYALTHQAGTPPPVLI